MFRESLKYFTFLVFMGVCCMTVNGQIKTVADDATISEDSATAVILYEKAKKEYSSNNFDLAKETATQALQLAMRSNQKEIEASILSIIGEIDLSQDLPGDALPFWLRAADIYESWNDTSSLALMYSKIAECYYREGIYVKENEYLLKALLITPYAYYEKRKEYLEKISLSLLNENKNDSAIIFLEDLRELNNLNGTDDSYVLNYLIEAYNNLELYNKALEFNNLLFKRFQGQKNYTAMSALKNNIAYDFTLLGQYNDAINAYDEAIEYGKTAGINEKDLALLMTNAGICSQNMQRPDEARNYFMMALSVLKSPDNLAEKSRIENIIALIYFNEMDLYNAGTWSKNSIESAKLAKDPWKLSEGYLTYSRILRAGNDPTGALENYEKYLSIRDSLQLESKLKEQELAKRQYDLERSEKDLKIELKEERVKELTIQQLTLQLQKEEQQRELLEREKDLQMLEKERLKQSLVITQQQRAAERQEREKQILEQDKRISDLRLEQQARKQKEQEQEIVLLEQQKQLDKLELDKQRNTKKALTLIVILVFFIAMVVLGSLLVTRKKNLLLARQKKEIEKKNVDLEQKNEEIISQRDEIEAQRNLLYDQKQAIEQINREIRESIEYAKRIQSSTLPDLSLLDSIISEHFVFFRPRDIVSGDFYWTAKVENATVITVSDCTGHGVPGSFMSILGISLLKEIVQKEYITYPGVILRRLRKEIINALGQKGIAGEQRDGMDISLITLHSDSKKLEFAGAFNPLYLVRKKDLPGPGINNMSVMDLNTDCKYVLYEIYADKMPIGYWERMDKFNTLDFDILEGDSLYLFTDGYADQFGGPAGKKFKYKSFKKLLIENAHLPLEDQKQVLDDTLNKWMGLVEQVDDICVVGLKI
jgi:serine phosphatase RsbU (regulator of sigma subunit)/tetratricopeptide (TPR) repeat protein